VNDQICTPTYTVDLAEATIGLLKTGQYGLYHLTNSDCCSWFEFAQAIFEMEGIKADLNPIPSSDYPTAAQRPSYSVLAAKAFEARGFAQLRPWRTALAAFLSERRK
jgi:dTDP-4-dehydrorhamnose reductase